MNSEIIYSILYGIIYKITDEFYDEEVYNKWFPNGKIVIYCISIFSTIFLFYFRSRDSPTYLLLYVANIFYIITLILKYYQNVFFCQLGDMNLSFDDPFTHLAIIQLPGFLINLKHVFTIHSIKILYLIWVALIITICGEIVIPIIGTSIMKKKFNKIECENKTNKAIFRLAGIFFQISLMYYYNEPYIKSLILYSIAYNITSVISLIIQQLEEERIISDNLLKEIEKLQIKLNNIHN
tara:strand:+ start:825 stop:1538 length:714 start_codon:yes stop_codon:yes gene_type:complete